jgi:hypothetical protein
MFEQMFDAASGGGDLDPHRHLGRRGRPTCARRSQMRRYDDPVEVRRGPLGGAIDGAIDGGIDGAIRGGAGAAQEGPEQFLWRGRLWKVRSVVAHWVETAPWWQSAGVQAVVGTDGEPVAGAAVERAGRPQGSDDLLVERELWRVHAGRGSAADDGGGVFDLSFDWSDGRWLLVGCLD